MQIARASQRIALLFVAFAAVALIAVWWHQLSTAERWVLQYGWRTTDDLRAIARGEIRNLAWPLIDATVVSGKGYVVVSVHDETETELLFTTDKAGLDAFAREANGQSFKTIYGSWSEVVIVRP